MSRVALDRWLSYTVTIVREFQMHNFPELHKILSFTIT